MSPGIRNERAGALIHELRVDRGLSPEALSYAIYKAGLGSVSSRTIRRIESDGMVPRVGNQFAIAAYFDRKVTSIWEPTATKVKA